MLKYCEPVQEGLQAGRYRQGKDREDRQLDNKADRQIGQNSNWPGSQIREDKTRQWRKNIDRPSCRYESKQMRLTGGKQSQTGI